MALDSRVWSVGVESCGVALSFGVRIRFWLCVVVVWCVWIATPLLAHCLAMTETRFVYKRILGFAMILGVF